MKVIKEAELSQLEVGKQVEMEHKETLNKIKSYFETNGSWPEIEQIAEWIAEDHLKEFSDYYTRLIRMEIDAKNDQEAFKDESKNLLMKESVIKENIDVPSDKQKEIIGYVVSHENLDDTEFHNFVMSIGVDSHEAEEVVYAYMRDKVLNEARYAFEVKYKTDKGNIEKRVVDGNNEADAKERFLRNAPDNYIEIVSMVRGVKESVIKENVEDDFYDALDLAIKDYKEDSLNKSKQSAEKLKKDFIDDLVKNFSGKEYEKGKSFTKDYIIKIANETFSKSIKESALNLNEGLKETVYSQKDKDTAKGLKKKGLSKEEIVDHLISVNKMTKDNAKFLFTDLFNESMANLKSLTLKEDHIIEGKFFKKGSKIKIRESNVEIDKLVDALSSIKSSYNDIKEVSVEGTPKGNWRVYYSGKDTGLTYPGNRLSSSTIEKYGLEYHE